MTTYKDLNERFILEENFNSSFKNHFENSELHKTLIERRSHQVSYQYKNTYLLIDSWKIVDLIDFLIKEISLN